MFATVFGFVLFCIFIARNFFLRSSRILKLVPGPPGLPVIGNVPEIFYKSPGDLFTILRTFSTKYSIYRLSLGPVDIINIVNPEDMEQILTGYQHMSKSKLYSYFKSWLGTGLLTSTGEKWHNRRKLLTPAFHFMVLQEFLAVFRDETEKVIAKIDETLKDGEIIEIMPIVIQFTLQTIGETAMGLKNIDDSFLNIYKNNVLEMGRIVINRVIRPWCDEDFIYRLTRYYRDEKQVAKRLHHFSRTIIDQRKRTFIQNKPLNCEKKKRLLDILLQAKEDGADIDDDGIREEVDTFMFEGHDTTAAALSLILMLLADNPEHQERVVVEILETVGHHSDLTYAEAQKLPYLERCIKEGLRLYPSVPMISRKAGCDFVTSSGYRIPSGTTLHMHIFDLHRKPNIYPDPNRFDPDRFLKENCIGRHPFAYLPFSAGPRNCIGQKFAMLEMKTFLIGILRKFKMQAITKQSDIVLEPDFVLKTSEPIKIKFSKR